MKLPFSVVMDRKMPFENCLLAEFNSLIRNIFFQYSGPRLDRKMSSC